MGLYETYRSKGFRQDVIEIRNQEWTDFDDFWEKYGEETNPDAWTSWLTVAAFFNGVGVLLKRNLIDIILVEDLLSNVVFGMWSRMEVPLHGYRKWQTRTLFGLEILHGFEYLYKQLKQRASPVPTVISDNKKRIISRFHSFFNPILLSGFFRVNLLFWLYPILFCARVCISLKECNSILH
jgi:hypothetical protein